MTNQVTDATVTARLDRLPVSRWHVRMLLIAGFATFSDAFDSLAIAFVLPILVTLWHISPAEIGFLISAGYVGQMAGAIGFGWVAERFGRRTTLQLTVGIISVFSLACAFAGNYLSLFILRTIQGLGLGGEVPVAAAYMNEIVPSSVRGRIVILLQSTFSFGIVITSLVSVWVVPNLGWQWMFYIGAVPAVLALFLRWLLPESPRWLVSQRRFQEAEAALEKIENDVSAGGKVALPAITSRIPVDTESRATFLSLFQNGYAGRTVALWTLMMCASLAGYGLLTWMPTIYRTVLKVPVSEALQYGLVGSIGACLGAWTAAFLLDWCGRRWTFMLGFFGTAVALGILWKVALGIPTIYVVALVAVGLFFISMLLGGLYLYAAELYPTRMRALGTGTASSWLRCGAIVGPSLVGWILGVSDLSSVFLMFAAAAVVGGLVILFFAVETSRKPLEELAT